MGENEKKCNGANYRHKHLYATGNGVCSDISVGFQWVYAFLIVFFEEIMG